MPVSHSAHEAGLIRTADRLQVLYQRHRLVCARQSAPLGRNYQTGSIGGINGGRNSISMVLDYLVVISPALVRPEVSILSLLGPTLLHVLISIHRHDFRVHHGGRQEQSLPAKEERFPSVDASGSWSIPFPSTNPDSRIPVHTVPISCNSILMRQGRRRLASRR